MIGVSVATLRNWETREGVLQTDRRWRFSAWLPGIQRRSSTRDTPSQSEERHKVCRRPSATVIGGRA